MKLKYFLLSLFLFISCNTLSAQEKLELFFDFDKDIPNESSAEKLTNWLETVGPINITKIEGYCDFADTDAYNKDLSLRRANSVLSTLQSSNLNIENPEIIGFGENFKQSKIQSENRKAIVYYEPIVKEIEEPLKESKLLKQIIESKIGEKYKLENLNFYNYSDVVVPDSKPILMELLQIMKANENLKIEIHGHICCMIDDTYQISNLRARRVYNYLLYNGIDKNRLAYKSFGSTRPIYPLPERTEEERDANRRVEIMVISK